MWWGWPGSRGRGNAEDTLLLQYFTRREHVRVYHLRKGVFLHKIQLKYPNFKEIHRLVSLHSCLVALMDNDKANLVNCTERRFSRYSTVFYFCTLPHSAELSSTGPAP